MFILDERIESTCFFLSDWPLCRVLLKNESTYPWIILVPRKNNLQELLDLEKKERDLLMDEIHKASCIIKHYFKPDKLNVATLGNIVSQLHLHIVGRSHNDALWPQGVWQSALQSLPYTEEQLETLLPALRKNMEYSAQEKTP